jgi:tetratricopeptide (TPR) repeat protein
VSSRAHLFPWRTARSFSLALALLCATAPSYAQDVPGAEPVNAAESEQTRFARELTLRARERFEAGDYAAALAEFTRAYGLLASDPRRADLLNNIAVCHERLFRYDLALEYYQRYLREAPSDPADRAEVEAVVRGLRDLLGKLHITSNVRAQIWIDDSARGHAPGDVTVPAGRHVIKLEARGRLPEQRELEVRARATQSVHFELEPLPEYHGIAPGYFWTGLGLSAAVGLAGGGLAIAAAVKHRDNLERQDLVLPLYEEEKDKRRVGIPAMVCFGTAALFGVATTVLFFLTDFHAAERPQPRTAKLSLTPAVGRATLGLSVTGEL